MMVLGLGLVTAKAQTNERVTGPKYKNQKVWEKEPSNTILYTVEGDQELTGAEYKNQKVWEKEAEGEKVRVKYERREKVTGGRYKNRKPWQK